MSQEARVWKAHSGFTAWPTLLLSVMAFALHLGALIAFAFGRIGAPGVFGLATLAGYLAFTPMHEAAHGNVAGRARAKGLDRFVGMLSGLQLLAPFGAFKAVHLRHHSQTNHVEHDPDMWVAARGKGPLVRVVSVLLRCATILPHYYINFLVGDVSRTRGGQEARTGVVLTALVFLLAIVGFSVAGFVELVFFGWVLPAFAATAVLAFFFDWLPHADHDTRGRYHDTRAIDAPLGVPLLGQHLHLVHHLYPRVPFHRYRQVFDELRPVLEEKGATIVTLSGRAARPLKAD